MTPDPQRTRIAELEHEVKRLEDELLQVYRERNELRRRVQALEVRL